MKKIIVMLAVLVIAAPAMATVTVSCVGAGGTCTVSYVADGNLPRAFALDVSISAGTIVSVGDLNADYWVYPGSIVIVDGEVTDVGTPVAEGGVGESSMVIEMGSLYEEGVEPAPPASGVLFSFTIDTECDVTIAENAQRGGVVMEDPDEEPVVVIPGCYIGPVVTDCLIGGYAHANEFFDWESWGKPDCWCYARQCRGDADGLKTGPFWVALPDLNLFRLAFNKTDAVLGGVTNGICCDFDHTKTGPFRVAIPDLYILRYYFHILELVLDTCDQPPLTTGPYNFWTN